MTIRYRFYRYESNIVILGHLRAFYFSSAIRLFQPVQYGTKPEGRLATITSAAGPRPPTSSPSSTSTTVSTTSQSALARGKSPNAVATTTTSSHGESSSSLKRNPQSLTGSKCGSYCIFPVMLELLWVAMLPGISKRLTLCVIGALCLLKNLESWNYMWGWFSGFFECLARFFSHVQTRDVNN